MCPSPLFTSTISRAYNTQMYTLTNTWIRVWVCVLLVSRRIWRSVTSNFVQDSKQFHLYNSLLTSTYLVNSKAMVNAASCDFLRFGSVFHALLFYLYLMWSIFPHAMFFFLQNLSNQYKKGFWGARLHPMPECFNVTSSYNFQLCVYLLLQRLSTLHTYVCSVHVDTCACCGCLRSLLLISWFTHQTIAPSISISY